MTSLDNVSVFTRLMSDYIIGLDAPIIWLSIDLRSVCGSLGIKDRSDINNLCSRLQALCNRIADESGKDIIIPAFTFTFGQSGLFDVNTEVPKVSGFSKYLFKQGVDRTCHPIYSFFVFNGEEIVPFLEMSDCVGEHSPFGYLNNQEVRVVSIGHHVASALSSIHQVEYELNVDYREVVFLEGLIVDHNQASFDVRSKYFGRKSSICSFSSVTREGVDQLKINKLLSCSCLDVEHGIIVYELDLSRSMLYLKQNHNMRLPMVDSVNPTDFFITDNTFLPSDGLKEYKKDLDRLR